MARKVSHEKKEAFPAKEQACTSLSEGHPDFSQLEQNVLRFHRIIYGKREDVYLC